MKYRYVGKSGLRVSPICMGTMGFGTWSDKKQAFSILDTSHDKGINFFDTAEVYPVPPSAKLAGLTEEIFGEWIKTKPRESIIVATKVAREVQEAFDKLAVRKYRVTRAELLRACVIDCPKRHEGK